MNLFQPKSIFTSLLPSKTFWLQNKRIKHSLILNFIYSDQFLGCL